MFVPLTEVVVLHPCFDTKSVINARSNTQPRRAAGLFSDEGANTPSIVLVVNCGQRSEKLHRWKGWCSQDLVEPWGKLQRSCRLGSSLDSDEGNGT